MSLNEPKSALFDKKGGLSSLPPILDRSALPGSKLITEDIDNFNIDQFGA